MQAAEVSSATIRDWSKRGLVDIRTHKYHRQDGSPKQREQLKNDGELVRHSIFDRSQVVESRKQFGHWEIDLVLPAKMNNQRYQDTTAIMTFTERKTLFTALVLVHSKKSSDMVDAFKLFYERYGKAVRTITADNGSEFISWDFLEYVQKELKIKLYYATPSSPQQRGSNENRNRKLRDWYPKGTSFKDVN